jgi:hypothetical protein
MNLSHPQIERYRSGRQMRSLSSLAGALLVAKG